MLWRKRETERFACEDFVSDRVRSSNTTWYITERVQRAWDILPRVKGFVPSNGNDLMNRQTQSRTAFQRRQILIHSQVFFATLLRPRWIRLLLCSAVLLFLVIRPFVFRSYVIPSWSMAETLLKGDRVLVCKFIYGVRMPYTRFLLLPVRQPRHGDICVAHLTKDLLGGGKPFDVIKRIVGLSGDVIEIRAGKLYRNGSLVLEPYARYLDVKRRLDSPRDSYGPYYVPKEHVFLMGDNRDASIDSRWLGAIPMKNLVGPAFLIYWSWDKKADFFHHFRFSRIGWLSSKGEFRHAFMSEAPAYNS